MNDSLSMPDAVTHWLRRQDWTAEGRHDGNPDLWPPPPHYDEDQVKERRPDASEPSSRVRHHRPAPTATRTPTPSATLVADAPPVQRRNDEIRPRP